MTRSALQQRRDRPDRATPPSPKRSGENMLERRAAVSSAAATQYARLNFAWYGVPGFISFTISYPGP